MAALDQFFKKEMALACELIGCPLERWWVIQTVNGIPLCHKRKILFIFSSEDSALIFWKNNLDSFQLDQHFLCPMQWGCIVEDYENRYDGVALDWMGPLVGFENHGKCYPLKIFF